MFSFQFYLLVPPPLRKREGEGGGRAFGERLPSKKA